MFISVRKDKSGERLIKKYHIQKKLADGRFGSVFIALDKEAKQTVVLKCSKNNAKAANEIEILNLLSKSKSGSKKYIGLYS